jgi:hypothetical protein
VKLVVNEAALQERGRAHSGSDPLGETSLDRWLDEPFPDYDIGLVMAFSATRTRRHPVSRRLIAASLRGCAGFAGASSVEGTLPLKGRPHLRPATAEVLFQFRTNIRTSEISPPASTADPMA